MSSEPEFVQRSRDLDLGEEGRLRLSEITVHPRSGIELVSSESSIQCILPLIGDLKLNSGLEIQLGELWSRSMTSGEKTSLINAGSSESAHFLRLELPSSSYVPETFSPFLKKRIENQLHPIFVHKSRMEYFRISLGVIGGRREAEFSTSASSLAFVASGAVEYQNRLLEQGDSLWISGAAEIEMESLAEESLILILEIANKTTKSIDSLLN